MKSLAIALCLLASPTLAQITPAQVLESWQQFSSRNEAGFSFARQEGAAEEITLYNVTLSGGVPAALPWLKLVAVEGGAVDISTANSLEWESPIFAPYQAFTTRGTVQLQGLSIQASGTPDEVQYAFALDSLSSIITDDYRASIDHTTLTMRGLSGTLIHRWVADLGDAFEAKLIVGLWEANTDSTIRGENAGQQHDSITNVSMAFKAALSQLETSTVSFDSGALVRRVAYGSDFLTEITASSTAVSGSGNLNSPFLRVHLTDITMTHRSGNQTFPDLNIQYDTLLLDASAANRIAGAHYPWQLEARLEGLELSPDTWALIDPSAALPHEPSHLVAELSGTGVWPEGEAPTSPYLWLSEIQSLTLKTLNANFGGVRVLASGTVEFRDNSGQSFGPPTPNDGQISLRMQGAQTLLNALGAGPLGAPFLADILTATATAGQPLNDMDVQILFDAEGRASVE